MNRRLAALFVVAVAGVLLAVGLALSSLGWGAVLGYLLLVALVASPVVRHARALRRAARRPRPGATCTCCTSSVHDPVQVV